jgi:hypothetical protein
LGAKLKPNIVIWATKGCDMIVIRF